MMCNSDRKNERNERLDWLDILKCLVIYLVILGHVLDSEVRSSPDSYGFYIYSFHMPLFFAISGSAFYLQNSRRNFNFLELLKNKSKSLLWPYLTLNIIAIFIYYFNFGILAKNYNVSPLFEKIAGIFYSNELEFLGPSNATWFLLTLFLVNIAFFLIAQYFNDKENLLIIASCIICSFGYSMSLRNSDFHAPWHFETAPIALLFFTIGYVIIQHMDKVKLIIGGKKRQVIIVLILFPIGFMCARSNHYISMAGNQYGSFMRFFGAVVAFSTICYIIAVNAPKFKIFKFIGRNTIVILAFHVPMMSTMNNLSDTTANLVEYHPIIAGTIIFILMIPICYIFDRWIPFVIGRRSKRKLIKK